MTVCDGPTDLSTSCSRLEVSGRYTGMASAREIDSNQRKETSPVSHLELNLAPTAQDMPELAVALIRAIIAAAEGQG